MSSRGGMLAPAPQAPRRLPSPSPPLNTFAFAPEPSALPLAQFMLRVPVLLPSPRTLEALAFATAAMILRPIVPNHAQLRVRRELNAI